MDIISFELDWMNFNQMLYLNQIAFYSNDKVAYLIVEHRFDPQLSSVIVTKCDCDCNLLWRDWISLGKLTGGSVYLISCRRLLC